MLTYLTIGVSVQVAWFVFTIIRRMTSSIVNVKGLSEWFGVIAMSAINVILWPISLVMNLIASYHTELLKEES